ncbi:universal stress protein [Thermoproteus tenax]|uniref:Nucleotide-binding protein, UspA family n=1 Tax=Thermoproteus tenax (strain ATCC 35583 / DSM 2078 / JCM 9277 / NBRC 100435 / Kra 1) TaxID=768679 RepID=G4RQ44_THETK|nr:universal stress protein [Thermoproteus tenax]CCC80681.1 Nucleotide-binding protein, UspA family [Thermoproteus tenax Kra 1]
MFKKILVAYDGSNHAKKALDVAIDLSKKYGAKLYIIEVIDTATILGLSMGPVPAEVIDSIRERAKADLNDAKARAESQGVQAETLMLEGDPAGTIVDQADKLGVDLIVTGSRGLSTIKRVFLGSVSTGIVTHARKPVLVVK